MAFPTEAVTRLGLWNGQPHDAATNVYGMGEGGFRLTFAGTGLKNWDQWLADGGAALAYLGEQVENAGLVETYLGEANTAKDGAEAAQAEAESARDALNTLADRLSPGRMYHEASARFARVDAA